MDFGETDELVFFVNGKKIVEKFPEPETSLLQYLRRTPLLVLLTGTKEVCGHGGCGSCTVMVSRLDTDTKNIRHYTVNACLFPLCAAHGVAITTVEGVGNPKTGLHEVQRRLVESHGLQCGMCTPGFVMSIFTLLRNNPKPTRDELEKAIEGNLCRCTGYRPIIQAFNTLCQDACPQGDLCCKNQAKASTSQENIDQESVENSDKTQVPIFPPELQISDKYSSTLVKFKGCKWTWIRPTTFNQLVGLKQEYPDAPVIMGNTTAALLLKLGKFRGNILIYGGGIPSLKTVEVTNDGIVLGAGLTINELEESLKPIQPQIPENRQKQFPALFDMIRYYGADQIRNTATLGGSILSGKSNSDIITLLIGCGASVNVESVSSKRTVPVDGLILENGEVLSSIFLPHTNEHVWISFYKQSERRTFSHALVNSCMFVHLTESGDVECLRLAFGGMGKQAMMFEELASQCAGRNWNSKLCQDILQDLPDVVTSKFGQVDDKYKLALVSGFVVKFFDEVNRQTITPSSPANDSSIVASLGMAPCCGTQVYEPFTEPGQRMTDSVHRPIPHVSSEAIVSGEAVYIDDIPSKAGELFLAFVTSKRAHALITSVDPSAALRLPGVHGFVDHTDVKGENTWGFMFMEEEFFASEKVIFHGQPIAGIVAETRELARAASYLVKVEYQDLKPILTIEEAIKENSLYETNSEVSVGSTEDGFQASTHVVEGEFRAGSQEHFYFEPHSCLAVPVGEFDEMDMHVSTHNLLFAQECASRALGVPCNKITCTLRRAGGSFGGKETRHIMIAGPTAVAAQKFKRPVRCIFTREMDMEITGKRSPLLAKYKVGFLPTGKIKALDLTIYSNGGSSLEMSGLIMDRLRDDFNGAYRIENLNFTGLVCKTNVPSNSAFRSYGSAEGLMAMEDIIFKIACKLDLSQDKVREMNFFNKNDLTKYGTPLINFSVRELWERCRQQSSYTDRIKAVSEFNRQNRWTKRGLVMTAARYTLGMTKFLYQGTAIVNIYKDGTVLLTHGGVEIGQGINTKMIQVASRVLGIPADLIYTSDSNTRSTPNATVTAGSMGTDIYGPAVMDACTILRDRLEPLREKYPDLSWKDLIMTAYYDRVKLTATGFSRHPKEEYDPVTETGNVADYFIYGVVCTEVEIDVLTGENQVLQADIVMDVGKSLNPGIDIGQIEGAFIQGLGGMTTEYIDVDENGKMMNCSPVSYMIPNVRSIPRKFNVTLVQEDKIVTPVYSAKGIGEPPLLLSVSVLMAIKEAVKAARAEIGLLGYFRLDCPATVERIRMACGDQMKKT